MRSIEALESRRLMADFSASVNFQPLAAHRAPGLLTDYGTAYGVKRGGLTYGWDRDVTANAVERNVTMVQKNDTFINMPAGSTWAIAVPNGDYTVYVVAGDPAAAGSRMALSVEGNLAIAGITKPSKLFLEGAVNVTVADGALSVKSVGEFGQDKLSYLAIVPAGTTPPVTTPDTPGVTITNKISWATGQKELVPTTEPESAVVGGKLYVFSGYGDKVGTGGDGWQPSKVVQRYDPATGSWSKIGEMPLATTHAAVTVVGTDVWFAGGYTARAGTTTKQDVTSVNVWIYHTTTNTWEKGPNLPARRASAGMVLVNNKLYFVSGEPQDHHSDVKDVLTLDLANKSAGWKAVAPIPEGRTHFGIAVVNNKIYVLGGQKDIDANATFLKTAYSYDPATNKWTRIADLPSIRSHLSPNTFVLNGKIFSIGGEYKFNFEMNNVLTYDPTTNKFVELTPIPGKRAAGAAAFIGGKIVFTGGKNNGFFSDTYIGTFV